MWYYSNAMINFVLGAILSGTVLIIIYLTLFSKRKLINYRRKDQLERLITQQNFDFLLIDVRTEAEYDKAHIPGAVSIPYKKLVTSLPVENMFMTIIVYGGNRKISNKAAEFLGNSGYFNVTSFGALSRWNGKLVRNEYIGDNHIEDSGKGRINFPV
ncbi:MAG: rhodanese-like domain-containing protein [Spirochaetaceae bacterium]|nr:rhodanese-like domain-containing protein [Spirochaetaceae bacterium]